MRRTHLRRHPNILKRLLIHAAAFNLGLLMRDLTGSGTPRQMKERAASLFLSLTLLLRVGRHGFQPVIQVPGCNVRPTCIALKTSLSLPWVKLSTFSKTTSASGC